MKAKTFPGGFWFRKYRGQPVDTLINIGVPSQVIIPLSQGFGSSCEPLVKKGDMVKAGQIIARDDASISSPIHSSANGNVRAVVKMNYFKREVGMVVIDTDGTDSIERLDGHSPAWEKLSAEQLEELLYLSGVTALDREGIPTRFRSSIIMPEEVEDLIIHGACSETYNISLELLLKGKNLFNFVNGIKILKKIMSKAHVHLALSKEKTDLIEKIQKLVSHMENFTIHPVVPKYPQGYDEVLIPTLLAKKFPYGYSAANIGVVVLNIQAVLHAFEAVTEGIPVIERTMALCGPSFRENIHVKVRIGTPLDYIVKGRVTDEPSRLVINSLLTGIELNDLFLPIDKAFSQIIGMPEDAHREFLTFVRPGMRRDSYSRSFASFFLNAKKLCGTNLQGEERPCFQCGYCVEVCPVKILPTLINRHIRLGINEDLMKHGIFNCIDCNLCSYVCPSKIPLAKNLKEAKSKLVDSGCDHSLCILPRFNLKGLEEYNGVKSIR